MVEVEKSTLTLFWHKINVLLNYAVVLIEHTYLKIAELIRFNK